MADKNKIRLVILIGQLGLGGGEKQLYLLLKSLDRNRFDPYVISFNPGASDYWEEPIRTIPVTIQYVPKKGGKLLRIIKALRLLNASRPDVIHSWDVFANPVVCLARLFSPAVGIGGVRCNIYRPGRSSFDRFIASFGIKNFITNSSQGKEHLMKLGKKSENIAIVFNAVAIPARQVKKNQIRAALAVSDEDILILHVGSIKPVKDQKFLIDAALPLMKNKRIHVVFIGEGTDRPKLMEYVQQKGHADRIKFPGQLPEAIEYMMASDIYCLTSVTEGMSNALCEAMACALPVLSTAVGGVKDLINDGENGFVIPHGSVDVFREKLELLISDADLRVKLGNNARLTVSGNFTYQHFTDRMSNAYEKFYSRSR